MIPLIAVPILNRPDLLQRLVDSIDFPVGQLLVINNGPGEIYQEYAKIRSDWNLIKSRGFQNNCENKGCAGAWNQAIDIAFNHEKSDYLLIFGNDIQFTPGDLQKMHEAVTSETDFVSGNWAFSSWGLTRRGFDKLGWVDEEIWPAYGEDVDYWRRIQLHGDIKISSADTHMIHGEAPTWGSSTIYSDPELRRKNGVTHDRNLSYLERKWNWDRHKPMASATFTTPFNRGGSLSDWQLSPDRLKQPHYRSHG